MVDSSNKIVTQIESGTINNIELNAKFEPLTYTITYNNNGGSTHNNPTSYHIIDSDIVLAETIKDGYEFWAGIT